MEFFDTYFNFLSGFFLGMSYGDFAIPIGLFLWFLLLKVQMKGVNCADPVTGGVYVCFCCAAGVTLLLAIPSEFIGATSFKTNIIWVLLLVSLASLRWFSEYIKQSREAEEAHRAQKVKD